MKPNKIYILSLLVLLITIIGCSREDPEKLTGTTDSTDLKSLAVYNLNVPEPSGLAYNHKNNTLFVVADSRSDIFEIDLLGNVLNTIPTAGFDLEGIALSKNCDTIFVVEEKDQRITTLSINGNTINSFKINVASSPNSALEGITRNSKKGRLIVINEKSPCLLLEFAGSTELWRKEIKYTSDISDICYEESSDSYWVLSDESKKILKLSTDGLLLSEWTIPVTKAEGIAIIQDKIYIVSDSESKMYLFQKP